LSSLIDKKCEISSIHTHTFISSFDWITTQVFCYSALLCVGSRTSGGWRPGVWSFTIWRHSWRQHRLQCKLCPSLIGLIISLVWGYHHFMFLQNMLDF